MSARCLWVLSAPVVWPGPLSSERTISGHGPDKGNVMSGIYGKYIVSKADATPVDPDAFYFVLRLDTDAAARNAIVHYADEIMESNPALAKELMARALFYDHKAGTDG